MTEKRFTSDKWQVYDKDKVITVDETVELLNMLHEENEEFKQQLKQILSRKDGLEWLRNNTVWEQMPTDIRTFTKTSYEK